MEQTGESRGNEGEERRALQFVGILSEDRRAQWSLGRGIVC